MNWIHYIGKGLYTETGFAKEAMKYGVNRAINPMVLKGINWGDTVYVAFFESDKNLFGEKLKCAGKATIFGYFTVTGLNPLCSDEVRKKLNDILKIKETVNGEPAAVERECGTYALSGVSYIVEDNIADIAEKGEKNGVDKWFVSGRFTPLADKISIPGIPFTRGYLKTAMLDKIKPAEKDRCNVRQIKNYKRQLN